ncbi:MAG: lytic transglycosylase domain-containing protein, partial [Bradyrhizobium sp.]
MGLVLAIGWTALATAASARPNVPLPKPRPIARSLVPKTTSAAKSPARPTAARTAPGRAAAAIEPATRQHAALPPLRRPPPAAAVAATSTTPQADADALENVIELVRKHKPADATEVEAAISDPVARKL